MKRHANMPASPTPVLATAANCALITSSTLWPISTTAKCSLSSRWATTSVTRWRLRRALTQGQGSNATRASILKVPFSKDKTFIHVYVVVVLLGKYFFTPEGGRNFLRNHLIKNNWWGLIMNWLKIVILHTSCRCAMHKPTHALHNFACHHVMRK